MNKRAFVFTDELIQDSCLTRKFINDELAKIFEAGEPLKVKICLSRTEYVISPLLENSKEGNR